MPAIRYWLEDEKTGRKIRVPSVTWILKQLGWSANGLMYWAWDAGYSGLTLDEAREDATGVGTVAHALLEADAHGLPLPDLSKLDEEMRAQVDQSFAAWTRWREKYDFKPIATEQSLVSKELRCGGTFDAAWTDGRRSLIDYKTSKAIYPDAVVQVAAYGLLWNEHHPDEPIQEYHLLRLSKEDGSFHHHSWPAESKVIAAGERVFRRCRGNYEDEKTIKGGI